VASKIAVAVLVLTTLSCSRRAEIADELSGAPPAAPPNVPDDAGLVSVASGLDGEPPCDERPTESLCSGANDFPCNFRPWVADIVGECQNATGCVSNGRVVATMGDSGCITEVLMSEPNQGFVECLAARFGVVRCPCTADSTEETLGYENDGCPEQPCGTGEIRCPPGSLCVGGLCRRDSGDAAGSSG